jgi:hypothetical protein
MGQIVNSRSIVYLPGGDANRRTTVQAALDAAGSPAALATSLADPVSAFPLAGVTGGQARTAEERSHDSLNAFEFMTRAQQADVRAGTALSNLSAALDVRAAIQAGIDYCQPLGIELVLPPYPMRIDADPAPPRPMQKGLRCLTDGEQPGLRIKGGGPLTTRLIPNFTNGVVLDIDGCASTTYHFQRTGWLKQFSIFPATEKAGVVGVRWAGCFNVEVSHFHIQNVGSHAMWFPWRGDKGGNTYTTNPDGWSCGLFSFSQCRFYGNGGWAVLQESGIGGWAFLFDNFYFLQNRRGGVFLSGPAHELRKGVLATNGQDDDLYGWGLIIARRMGQGAGTVLNGPVEFDSNWAGSVWAQAPNGMRMENIRNNSWTTQYPGIGVADTQMRPPVHIRLGGSVASAVAQRVDMIRCAHRSQNVAAGASAEKQVVWYQAHDSVSFFGGQIQNPFNDSQSANAQRYSQGGGAMFTATISGGAVTGFVRKSGGIGYSAGTPTVTISGGGGSGATGTAVVDGQLVEIIPTDPGLGYTPGDVLTVTLSAAGGSGHAATALVDEWGQVWSYTITNPGTGLTSAPTATLPAPPAGGTTRQATCQAAWSKTVGSITLGAGGTGYTSAPDVIIVPADLRATNLVNFKLDIMETNQVVATCGQSPACRYRSTAGTISVAGTGTTPTLVKYETAIADNYALYSTSTGQATAPYTGLARVRAKIGFTGLTAGDIVEFGIYDGGTVRDIKRFKAVGIATAIGGGSGGETFEIAGSYAFAKGNTIDVRALTSHGSALTISTVAAENTLDIEFVR